MQPDNEHKGLGAGAVRDNAAAHRFELDLGGGDLAIAAYRLDGDVVAFTHTEVPPHHEGRGIGARLVGAALEAVRERGLKVAPLCSFVARYVREHPETQDLLAPRR